MSDADRRLRKIADRQLNLVTRRQALMTEVGEKHLQRRAKSGVLRRIHAGVYLFGSGKLSPEQEALAACLACGEGAFASGRTSGALWGVIDSFDEVEVTVPDRAAPSHTGITVHRSRSTGRGEQTKLGCVPVATIARTLFDLDRSLGVAALERACDAAFRSHLITPERLEQYLRKKRGAKELRRIVRDRIAHGLHDTDFEKDAECVLLEHGLPRPERQYRCVVNGRAVRFDLYYPDERVAIEPNGRGPHWGKERWQADHDKRIAAKVAGVNMLEFTWDDVHERQLYFVTTVAEALGLRPSRWVRKDSAGLRTGAVHRPALEAFRPHRVPKAATTRPHGLPVQG